MAQPTPEEIDAAIKKLYEDGKLLWDCRPFIAGLISAPCEPDFDGRAPEHPDCGWRAP